MATQASNAQRQLAMDIDFPPGTLTFPTVGGQKEYQIPEICKILRIYILGPDGSMQEMIPTDIPTLSGEIQETFDNTSGGLGGAPLQTAQWLNQQNSPAAYPVNNTQIGGRVGTKSTWSHNSRPAYYLRGGFIGFVIPALTTNPASQIVLEYVASPPPLSTPSDVSLFPFLCKDALVWFMVARCLYSDNNSGTKDAMEMYNREMARLRDWSFSMQASKPKMMVPLTKRAHIRGRRFY
jgi:hypothetical protein